MAYNLAAMTVLVRSFAKINLGLRIGAVRPDGFHELLTVYQTIGLHDLIQVSVARGSGIEIRCDDPKVPKDESNTCYRMVEKAMEALRAKGRVVIDIEKRLPVQGGLGGASSNAVAALLGLERVLKKSLPSGCVSRPKWGRTCRCFWWVGRCWAWDAGNKCIRWKICGRRLAWW
jgi:4-diphosphocytidyl-2-C-methyl-D-erythritol kinase